MVDEKKVKQLEKEIAEKEKESKEIAEKRSHTMDPADMVALDKEISTTATMIEALKRTLKAVTYMPPQKTDVQDVVSCLDKYLNAKAEKVSVAQETIDKTLNELQKAESNLKDATAAAELDKVVEYSKQVEALRERLKYANQIKEAKESEQVFPAGAVAEEWKMVCDEKKSDFQTLISRIEMLASEYKAACNDLEKLLDTMLTARRQIKQIAEDHGAEFYPEQILTKGIEVDRLTISKAEGMKPLQLSGSVVFSENPI